MRNVTVYRVDYAKGTRIPVGWVVERRRRDRGNNILGLARLARNRFARSPEEAFRIVIDEKEARLAYL
jgi:hypothetical protein